MFCPNCGKEQVDGVAFCYNCGQKLTSPDQGIRPDAGQEAPYVKKEKKRHGCLTAYLIFLIIVSAGLSLYYISAGSTIKETLDLADWTIPVLIVLGVLEFVCAIALLIWKKWGFWGFCTISVIALIINLSSGINIFSSLSGLIGIAFLYGVLQIGDADNKGWPQLE